MRGCSRSNHSPSRSRTVFPAYAGMFPSAVVGIVGKLAFSPRMRGCSFWLITPIWGSKVFPAYAGMFPAPPTNTAESPCFPRVCGDVPPAFLQTYLGWEFSPHARGCSSWPQPSPPFGSVFPACAGMFRWCSGVSVCWCGFPRVRGDVPLVFRGERLLVWFSPHTRGCSLSKPIGRVSKAVFPAYAGMFPAPGNHSNPGGCFPRMHAGMFHGWCLRCARQRGFPCIRGDVPIIDVIKTAFGWFPRIRGDVPGHSIAVYFNEESSPRA